LFLSSVFLLYFHLLFQRCHERSNKQLPIFMFFIFTWLSPDQLYWLTCSNFLFWSWSLLVIFFFFFTFEINLVFKCQHYFLFLYMIDLKAKRFSKIRWLLCLCLVSKLSFSLPQSCLPFSVKVKREQSLTYFHIVFLKIFFFLKPKQRPMNHDGKIIVNWFFFSKLLLFLDIYNIALHSFHHMQ